MTDLLAILVGMFTGIMLWAMFILPRRLDRHERERRMYGLPPARKLPEDEM